MTSDYLRRYYILRIITSPYNFGITTDEYVSLEQLELALADVKSQNIDNPLFAKLDYCSQKNIKRDIEKILSYSGTEIGYKRNYGYYIKSIDENKADVLKELYEKTELFILKTKKEEWKEYVSIQNTSLDGRFDFTQIIYAIENKFQIHIKFSGWYDNNKFEDLDVYVQPLHIKEAHKHWHLIGYNEKLGISSFSLDERMEELIITNKKVNAPIEFNAKEYFKHSIGILIDNTPVEKIVLKVANHHFKYLMIKKIHHSQKVIDYPKQPETNTTDYENPNIWGTIELTVQPNYEFLMEILKYNQWVKVISPPQVVDYIASHIKMVLAYYE